MNGKSCVYERVIGERIREMGTPDHPRKAFVIMPFSPDLDALYQWQIVPFIEKGGGGNEVPYQCKVERADDVRQVGYIMCEKICKKIQEADLVVVDLSFDNPNVFYEFGLCAALRKRILPVCYDQRYSKERENFLKTQFGIHKLIVCPSFGFMGGKIDEHLFNYSSLQNFDHWEGDKLNILHNGRELTMPYKDTAVSMKYKFGAICVTAAGTALSSVFSEKNLKDHPQLASYGTDKPKVDPDNSPRTYYPYKNAFEFDVGSLDFGQTIAKLRTSYCTLFDICSENPTIFFWLGYSHGLGEFAVPVNEVAVKAASKDEDAQNTTQTAFDIVALWHAYFDRQHPTPFANSLRDILEFVLLEKSKKIQRTVFWKDILTSNEASIFLGSLTVPELGRNTLGDWDYRTAAELTSFLTSEKETMEVTLESPIPKAAKTPDADEVRWLQGQLANKNCIIVASSDVNDLTECALAALHRKKPFQNISADDANIDGYIAYKRYVRTTDDEHFSRLLLTKRQDLAFLRLEVEPRVQPPGTHSKRGFIYRHGDKNSEKPILEKHLFPYEGTGQINHLLGHLTVAPNPFGDDRNKWVIVINGISGPATCGIAQMLTGCKYQEFTVNRYRIPGPNAESSLKDEFMREVQAFDVSLAKGTKTPKDGALIEIAYDELCEMSLSLINGLHVDSCPNGIEALIKVGVYYPATQQRHDERKIFAWHFPKLTNKDNVKIDNPRQRL
jgi:hypothetical protein